jgi:RNA polymerase sigma factor (sigma-70 family)
MHNNISDNDLWNRFKKGDKDAYKEIYYKYYMLLFNYGIRSSSDEGLTEDCIQDLFLKLWKNRENLGEITVIKSYLYRSFIRLLFDAIKKSRRVIDLNQFDTFEPSIEDALISNQLEAECKSKLQKAIGQLSKRHKQVIELHYIDGLSYKQMEEILPIKYQAIRNYVHEALKVLRKKIASL